MTRRVGNCTVKPGVRRRMVLQVLLALLGLGIGVAAMAWFAAVRGADVVLGVMNGLLLGSLLAAVLAGQIDRWSPGA